MGHTPNIHCIASQRHFNADSLWSTYVISYHLSNLWEELCWNKWISKKKSKRSCVPETFWSLFCRGLFSNSDWIMSDLINLIFSIFYIDHMSPSLVFWVSYPKILKKSFRGNGVCRAVGWKETFSVLVCHSPETSCQPNQCHRY